MAGFEGDAVGSSDTGLTKRVGFGLLAAMLAAFVTIGLSEGGLRMSRSSRVQRVTMDSSANPFVEDGVLLFQTPKHDILAGLDCLTPGKRVAVFVGDSIMYASAGDITPGSGNFAQVLRDRDTEDTWCFVNLSAPGYTGWQQAHLVNKALDQYHPDIIFWGLWKTDGAWLDLGADGWVDLGAASAPLDDLGYPVVPFVPTGLHRWLFRHSRVWQEVGIELSRRTAPPGSSLMGLELQQHLIQTGSRAAEEGVEFVVVQFPGLEVPFAESAAEERDPELVDWLSDHGLTLLDVAAALRDDSHLELRADPCCHYNVAGNRRLADLFGAAIEELVDEP